MNYGFEHEGKVYGPNGLIQTADVAAHNKRQEEAELAWLKTGPERVFLYVHGVKESSTWDATITTWLGTIVSAHPNIGRSVPVGGIAGRWATKRSVDCIIFGRRYVGWYWESAGQYCRLRLSKRQPKSAK